jgi:prevent-host-death family protein
MRSWQLQEAKARLSEVVASARRDGPQEISVRGEPAVVVVSSADFAALRRKKPSFVDFVRRSPLAGTALEIERDRTPARRVKL